ncbi:alpha/beta hydrolase [Paenibacillus bovis]|uniref:Enterobactin esterase n=1 Tax=Paenibacillus bovis TaxID=1616788 RepID=A0A172ZLT1_9BACL|nr:alpha/beta hydrolase-fold protein [Paenibacillus bovis]ANF98090.1 enterobactin esterase [Paenibacillus bovis]
MTLDNMEQPITEAVSQRIEVPQSRQWQMKSAVGDCIYQIMVYTPTGAPPAAGYPVIYLLDGNSVFATVVDAMRMQTRRPDKTGVIPAVIVGIGYETSEPFSASRYYDYTPRATSEYRQRPDGTPIPEQGGADQFLTFLEQELKPAIEAELPINRRRQAVFGHSLGGLFVLHTLFTQPEAFQYYIAGSPSIHWNHQLLDEEEQRFVAHCQSGKVTAEHLALLIGMGELERTHTARNNERSEQLIERLSVLKTIGMQMEYREYRDENHLSVVPILISRALRFALHP